MTTRTAELVLQIQTPGGTIAAPTPQRHPAGREPAELHAAAMQAPDAVATYQLQHLLTIQQVPVDAQGWHDDRVPVH